MSDAQAFFQARELLLRNREDYDIAYAEFRWPKLERFNWALDYFDDLARNNRRPALRIVSSSGKEECLSFAELSERSNRVANFLRRLGVQRGDRLLLMLGNVVPLWETTLAAMKLGAVVSPATTLLTRDDLADRIERGGLRYVVADASGAEAAFTPEGETKADDPFFLYFTSGTTAKPKMVLHTHQSYPVGHLTTMYWLGLREGDLHFNISSPGWAKHAWSSFFAPWNAGATIFVYDQPRFDARQILDALVRYEVSTLCAPPTVWRMLILEDLTAYPIKLREVASAGEPLNPEVMERVQAAWGLTIRDGYGQTETTALIANPPGQRVKPGSMGRPLPGYRIALFDGQGYNAEEGEVCVALQPRPVGLMAGYFGAPEQTAAALGGEYYHTGDVARRDEDGYFWYVGRADDVFKSSDYRISPFELESALIEHEAVAEAAVVPSPDPIRLSVPKAYLVLKPGYAPTRETALSVFRFTRQRLAPYKRVRRIEFYDLPKTISGKIRRVELRGLEVERRSRDARGEHEFWEEDFPELK